MIQTKQLPYAVFLDLDGTLCMPKKSPGKKILDGIQQVQRNGNKVFLCTGRAPAMLPDEIREIEWDGLILGIGAYVEIQGELRKDEPYTETEIKELRKIFEETETVYMLEGAEDSFMDLEKYSCLGVEGMEGINQEMEDLHSLVREFRISDISQYCGQKIYNIVFLSAEDERLQRIREQLEDKYRIAVHPAQNPGLITDIELVRKNVNKGKALQFVCEQCGIPLSCSIAFGDSMNDCDMLVAAGFGVAMGNGDEEIKSHADMVCESVEEDGLYRAFHKLKLIK